MRALDSFMTCDEVVANVLSARVSTQCLEVPILWHPLRHNKFVHTVY